MLFRRLWLTAAALLLLACPFCFCEAAPPEDQPPQVPQFPIESYDWPTA